MNIHANLKANYGSDILKKVRKWENSEQKLARFQNHLHFNLHCKHHHLTPTSLKLTRAVHGSRADQIIQKAERALLNIRISQMIARIDHLKQERRKARENTRDSLPRDLFNTIVVRMSEIQDGEYRKTKVRQQEKSNSTRINTALIPSQKHVLTNG